MFHEETTKEREQRSAGADRLAEQHWENEGGDNTRAVPGAAVPTKSAVTQESQEREISRSLDARQDELMTVASSDGRPPSRRQRMLEWRWFGVGAILIVAGIAAWIIAWGVSLRAVGVGLALGVLLLAGAVPVLAAGLLRGREERAARRGARSERRSRRERRVERRGVKPTR